MKLHKATSSIIIDLRRVKKDGSYPLRLSISYASKRRTYLIGRDLYKKEWEKMHNRHAKGQLKDLQTELNNIVAKANVVIREFEANEEVFSFVRFENVFFGGKIDENDINSAFKAKIELMQENEQISNASIYQCAQRSFNQFFEGRKYKFTDVDDKLLKRYENWMKKNDKSISTTALYLRSLRALFNIAKRKNIIKDQHYPFGIGKYTIPSGGSSDKGLSKEVIKALREYTPVKFSDEDCAKDLWFFSFLCSDINVKDICRLRFENVGQEQITFVRAKTERSNVHKPIKILLPEEAADIITKWGNEPVSREDYVFKYYYKGITAEEERRVTQNLTRVINNWMKKITGKLGLKVSITTYSARHTFGNIMMEVGAPLKLISGFFGHSSSEITERHYTGEFSLEQQQKYLQKFRDHIR